MIYEFLFARGKEKRRKYIKNKKKEKRRKENDARCKRGKEKIKVDA